MTEILITGATGFVGSHLVEALARRGIPARALVRPTSDVQWLERHGIERVLGDVTDGPSLDRALDGVDTVLHLAAATRALDADTFHRVNAEGTRRLVEAMGRGAGVRRLVYLSSLSAAGPRADRPVRPGDEPAPVTTYGHSKLLGEQACLASSAVAAAILRPPAVYGPRDRDLLPFFRLARMRLLPVVGSPARRLQLIHAADLADAILDAARAHDATGVFHVAEPRSYEWREVLSLVAAAVGRAGVRLPVPPSLVKLVAAVTEAVARVRRRPAIFDREKAREVLAPGWICETDAARAAFGFETSIPLAEGLRETAEWYRTYDWL